MSMRLEMLQVARLAPKLLGESTALVDAFLRGQQLLGGGFLDRNGAPDLYYTIFGADALLALQAGWNPLSLETYLSSFGSGARLDFVHRCCLARACAIAQVSAPGELPSLLEAFRTPEGGYNQLPNQAGGTVYGAFLALGAYQDLKLPLPHPDRLLESLRSLQTPDGAWANEASAKAGSSTATSAALTLLRNLNEPAPASAVAWLRAQAHPDGGFRAAPAAPLPDLLSTATALHALSGSGADLSDLREPCLDFIDTLWTNEGSFHGHWAEDTLDCEYTFYGLLALGHLTV